MTLTLPAPAKLNLFLHIVGRRPDGYHLLQTVFQLLDYGDDLRIESRDDGVITVSGMPDIPQQHNLAWRAAKKLQEHTHSHQGADIHLTKRLPLGGGVGGGSSNAATTLLGLNHLWQTQLSTAELLTLGQQLGADVPVFIHGHSAWAEGVGEQLTPVDLPPTWYVVLHPAVSVSTAEIFAHPQLTRNTPRITIADFLAGNSHNDCAPIVYQHYPAVRQAHDWLAQFGQVRLTGSGGCVFTSFSSHDAAAQVWDRIPEPFTGFVARGVNSSPLLLALEEIIK